MKISEQTVKDKLTEVMDPELNISIVDLGLVYGVELKKDKKIKITMTLTTIGCPLFNLIEQEAKIKLKELEIDEKNIEFDLTFDPPWSMEKMSERAKAMLGI
ncbi:hypothetical protein A3C28_00120 [Candidatus Roizmanbacteria bacterium RIFCSPHIGHO2_02_FULL_39_9]|uniref:MIP18 family-like domain-containing protein n=2 Tax=Candidatus Roizmaniibacteriota TaxID=1752723 RepID=A0A1F7I1K4_9BACT|nr:MAG: hypothetical protein A3C28_00120 [Candidatus Roizmanbacteria bacterium RIFCSPHIGHO2_02_FULL_39_9]OGK37234.1 MAG: hypothetical protein A3F60_02230 [Candidatus Roizmanbacteria bacterium RIFCSPHIGHO2_12_FULL_39_8]